MDGKIWYLRYPSSTGRHITVATTRPETMLGDTAVAVHPDDERYRAVVGRTFACRCRPAIPDRRGRLVDPEFGTGRSRSRRRTTRSTSRSASATGSSNLVVLTPTAA